MKDKHSIIAVVELLFDASYLIVTSILAVLFMTKGSDTIHRYWGIMALVLIFGDSFHLLPRMLSARKKDKSRYHKSLGIGKLLTSITMTIFYIFLWYLGMYLANISLTYMTMIIWILAIMRIMICLCPQNAWTRNPTNYKFGIYRNIPFLIQGLLTAWLFMVYPTGLPYMWIAILLSFGFYVPVVLFADKNAKYGMFMLPKTCVYVWMIVMGFYI